MSLEKLTAIDVVKEIVKAHIAPIMSSNGFKKKGNKFNRSIGNFEHIFRIYSSQWNTSDSAQFSYEADVKKHGKEITYAKRFKSVRTGKEPWYEVTPNTDINDEDLVSSIKADVQAFLPYFDDYK